MLDISTPFIVSSDIPSTFLTLIPAFTLLSTSTELALDMLKPECTVVSAIAQLHNNDTPFLS